MIQGFASAFAFQRLVPWAIFGMCMVPVFLYEVYRLALFIWRHLHWS